MICSWRRPSSLPTSCELPGGHLPVDDDDMETFEKGWNPTNPTWLVRKTSHRGEEEIDTLAVTSPTTSKEAACNGTTFLLKSYKYL